MTGLPVLHEHVYRKGWVRLLARESDALSAQAGDGLVRVWVQGIIVAVLSEEKALLDDGTGVVQMDVGPMASYDVWRGQLRPGQSLQVLGTLAGPTVEGATADIAAIKLVDVTDLHAQEAAFHLDVIMALHNRAVR